MIIYLEKDYEYLNLNKVPIEETHIHEDLDAFSIKNLVFKQQDKKSTWIFEPIDFEVTENLANELIKKTYVNENLSRSEKDINTKKRFIKEIHIL